MTQNVEVHPPPTWLRPCLSLYCTRLRDLALTNELAFFLARHICCAAKMVTN